MAKNWVPVTVKNSIETTKRLIFHSKKNNPKIRKLPRKMIWKIRGSLSFKIKFISSAFELKMHFVYLFHKWECDFFMQYAGYMKFSCLCPWLVVGYLIFFSNDNFKKLTYLFRKVFKKVRNGFDSFVKIEQTEMLVWRVDGIRIQTKSH